MKTWIAFGNILKKDIKNYYLKPPNISWGIIFPLSWTLMQFIRSPRSIEIIEFLPGLMGMSVLFGATSMLAITITFERKGRSFDRLLLAPLSLKMMMLAKITGALLFGVINAFWPLLFAVFVVDLAGISWIILVPGVFLISLTSTLIGLVIAISAKEVFEAQTFSNFFRFPMLFLSGLFLPVSKLPLLVQPISYCLPLTYGADLLNHALLHHGFISVCFNFAMLIGFAIMLFYICQRNIKRKWIL